MAKVSKTLTKPISNTLINQAIAILALATFAYCTWQDMALTTSLYRMVIVYLVGSILAYSMYSVSLSLRQTSSKSELEEDTELPSETEGDVNAEPESGVTA